MRLKPETLVQIIVAGVVGILGGIGWLMSTVYDMNGSLNALQSNVSATVVRVDRIASALPEMGRRVALEEIRTPIRTVVIAGRPTKSSAGSWTSDVYVIDAASAEGVSYSVALTSADDPAVLYTVTGSALSTEPAASSFVVMKGFSGELGDTLMVPGWVDAKSSFVLRSTGAREYQALLQAVDAFRTRSHKTSFGSDVSTWHKLSAALQKAPPQVLPGSELNRDSAKR